MRVRTLRRRCEQILRDVAVPAPFTPESLFADLARRRGRPIEVHLVDTPVSGPCAAWISLADKDHVLVERGSDPLHRMHMLLHEWAHIVCGHRGVLSAVPDWSRLLPDLDPAMVRQVLGRRSYTETEEAEAEMMASVILAHPDRRLPQPRQPFDGEVGPALETLTRALEGPGHGG